MSPLVMMWTAPESRITVTLMSPHVQLYIYRPRVGIVVGPSGVRSPDSEPHYPLGFGLRDCSSTSIWEASHFPSHCREYLGLTQASMGRDGQPFRLCKTPYSLQQAAWFSTTCCEQSNNTRPGRVRLISPPSMARVYGAGAKLACR